METFSGLGRARDLNSGRVCIKSNTYLNEMRFNGDYHGPKYLQQVHYTYFLPQVGSIVGWLAEYGSAKFQ
jgi:hypothetical protein